MNGSPYPPSEPASPQDIKNNHRPEEPAPDGAANPPLAAAARIPPSLPSALVRDEPYVLGATIAALSEAVMIIEAEPLDEPGPRIVYVNEAFTRLTGYTSEEVLGRSHRFLRGPRTSEKTAEAIEKALRTRQPIQCQILNYSKTGQEMWIDLSVTPIRDPDGEVRHFARIQRDITQQRRRDAQVLRSQRLESVGALAGGIAHDINNVLSPILLSVDQLRPEVVSERGRRALDTLEASARRGADLIRHVLTFSHGPEGERCPVRLEDICREIRAICSEALPPSIRLEIHCAPDTWPVLGDPTQILQMCLNLAVNARDAMPSGGVFRLDARNVQLDAAVVAAFPKCRPGPYVAVRAQDTGAGIPEHVLPRIFDPFFTTKSIGEGTGLGLAIVDGIVQSHGGFIDVQTAAGSGTTFTIYLPATVRSVSAPKSARPAPAAERHGTILLVDDEAPILHLCRRALEAQGYRVLTAQDGHAALEIFRSSADEIDLVLTDIMMPVMDGVELIRGIRELRPHTTVIAASGLVSRDLQTRLASAQPDFVIPKPFSISELLEVLDRAVATGSYRPAAKPPPSSPRPRP